MSNQKRERELARAKYERQQARRAERKQKARRNQTITATVVVVALVVAGVGWWGYQSTNQSELDAASTAPTESVEPTTDPTTEASADNTSEPTDETYAMDCTPIGTPRPNDISYPEGPTALESTPASMTLATNCGDIVIEFDPAAPETVASEAFLADSGFYNNTQCHRLTTEGIFVLQCGDPAGDGTGGPGYTVPDENLPSDTGVNYPAGTVAMANAGPGTSGSQFFIVYQDTTLPPAYTIWGTVVSGLDIVQEVASIGVSGGGSDGPPAQPIFINQATVS